jgi:hypothetical protein
MVCGHMTRLFWHQWWVPIYFFLGNLNCLHYHLNLQCLFEPRVIEFDYKRENFHPIGQNVTEEITGHNGDAVVSGLAALELSK